MVVTAQKKINKVTQKYNVATDSCGSESFLQRSENWNIRPNMLVNQNRWLWKC